MDRINLIDGLTFNYGGNKRASGMAEHLDNHEYHPLEVYSKDFDKQTPIMVSLKCIYQKYYSTNSQFSFTF